MDKKSEGSPRYLWGISLVAAGGGGVFGYDVVVISGVVPQVVEQFQLGAFHLGLLVSCVLWGCALGSITAGIVLDGLGRQKTLVLSALLFVVSSLWSAAAGSVEMLVLARLAGGLGCGMATTACPLYIAEVSPERHRGRMVTLYHLAVCTGIVVCVFVNWAIFTFAQGYDQAAPAQSPAHTVFIEQSWRAMLLSEALPGTIFLLCTLFLPKSPRWLIKEGRDREALTILERVNGRERAESIAVEIRNTLGLEEGMTFSSLFTTRLRRLLAAAMLLCVFSEACGISAVLYYGPQLFAEAGLALGDALGGFTVLAVVNMVFNLVALRYVDSVGRKKLLTIGATGAMCSLLLIGTLYLMGISGLVLVFFCATFMAFFASSIGPVKFVILSELFPNRVRGKAVALGTLSIWITSAAVAQLFPLMQTALPTGVIFYLFAADIAALILLVRYALPETRGLTIEEVERSTIGLSG